ncbi:MAG: pitrilysin family protein [Alphaproteobacteria bacterium]|nr:pitrilysin family protein [Alphaproteobacteria bacterium]
MSAQVSRLGNGFAVASDAMDGVETAAIGVWVGVGARHETPALNGVSHMLEHMAFKGTERRSAAAIVNEVESVGGQINAYTSRENTAYYLRVLADDIPLAVDILADILQHSTFAADELERERAVILQEIGQCNDTPDDLIFDQFQEAAYPDQALGRSILGTAANVRALDRGALDGYMKAQYGADRMVLAAAGKVDHERLVGLAEDAFGALPPLGVAEPESARYRGGQHLENRDLEQLHLVLGYGGVAYGDADYYTMGALASLLGGGMSSRLFQEVREKRGLVYSIYTFNSSYRDGGLFGLYAGTGEDQVRELMPVVLDELAAIGETVTDEEIDRVKAQLKAGLLMALENTRARAERLGQHMLVFGRPVPVEEIVARIDAVDGAAIAALAERVFAGPPTLAALGPVGQVEAAAGPVSAPTAAE